VRLDTTFAVLPERRRGPWARLSGIQLFVLSFAALILGGAAGFLVLPGLYTGPRLGVVDALFTSASAVCVTGLIVVDTATYFTRLGQAWILLLIQAGGLGILTFTTLIIRALGRRTALEVEAAAHAGVAAHLGDARALLRAVFAFTLTIEAVGAVGLWLLWRGPLGGTAAVWPAVFHAVSAFCNAGFSTFSDSLVGWRTSPPLLLSISTLIVLGGLGFVVLHDLRARFVHRSVRRLTTHSRLVLGTTAVLIVGATIVFLLFEGRHTLQPLSPVSRVVNALFMAITPRTAGFNTVDYNQISNSSLAFTIGLMFVGGSPGSTAGGIKTTSAALLVLVLVSRLRGHRQLSIGGRSVREDAVQGAVSLAVGAVAILAVAVFLLLLAEAAHGPGDRSDLARLAFESTSAFGTVGLSMNRTGALSGAGRLIITLLMFIGRVGPLGMTAAMVFARERGAPFRYAFDEVAVG
jgi:trk system potassium uptake protein TrkH